MSPGRGALGAARVGSHCGRMSAYDRTWTTLAAVVSAAGLFAAFRGYEVTVLLGMFLTASVLVVMWVLPFVADKPLVRPLTVTGVVAGLVMWVAMGAGRVAGLLGVLAVVVLAMLSPWALRAYGRILGRPRRRAGTPPGEPTEPSEPSEPAAAAVAPPAVALPEEGHQLAADLMSDDELCRAWRRSCVELQRSLSPQARLDVVAVRARLLEELELRAGPRFSEWLAAGSRAAGDPSSFLSPRDHDPGPKSAAD